MRSPLEKLQVVTQEFGETPGMYARYKMKAHNEIDFGAPVGTLVSAAVTV